MAEFINPGEGPAEPIANRDETEGVGQNNLQDTIDRLRSLQDKYKDLSSLSGMDMPRTQLESDLEDLNSLRDDLLQFARELNTSGEDSPETTRAQKRILSSATKLRELVNKLNAHLESTSQSKRVEKDNPNEDAQHQELTLDSIEVLFSSLEELYSPDSDLPMSRKALALDMERVDKITEMLRGFVIRNREALRRDAESLHKAHDLSRRLEATKNFLKKAEGVLSRSKEKVGENDSEQLEPSDKVRGGEGAEADSGGATGEAVTDGGDDNGDDGRDGKEAERASPDNRDFHESLRLLKFKLKQLGDDFDLKDEIFVEGEQELITYLLQLIFQANSLFKEAELNLHTATNSMVWNNFQIKEFEEALRELKNFRDKLIQERRDLIAGKSVKKLKEERDGRSREDLASEYETKIKRIMQTLIQYEDEGLSGHPAEEFIAEIGNDGYWEELGEWTDDAAYHSRIKTEVSARLSAARFYLKAKEVMRRSAAKFKDFPWDDLPALCDVGNIHKILFSSPELNGPLKRRRARLISARTGEVDMDVDLVVSAVGDVMRRMDRAIGKQQPLEIRTEASGDMAILSARNIHNSMGQAIEAISEEPEFQDVTPQAIRVGVNMWFAIIQGQSWLDPIEGQGISSDWQKVFKLHNYQRNYVRKAQFTGVPALPMILSEFRDVEGNSLEDPRTINWRSEIREIIPSKYTTEGSGGSLDSRGNVAVDAAGRKLVGRNNYDVWFPYGLSYQTPIKEPVEHQGECYSTYSPLFPTFLDYLEVGKFSNGRTMTGMDYVFIDYRHEDFGQQVYYEGLFNRMLELKQTNAWESYCKALGSDIGNFVLNTLYMSVDSLVGQLSQDKTRNEFVRNFIKDIGYCWPFFLSNRSATKEQRVVAMRKFRVMFIGHALGYAMAKDMVDSRTATDILHELAEISISPEISGTEVGTNEQFLSPEDENFLRQTIVREQLWMVLKKMAEVAEETIIAAGKGAR